MLGHYRWQATARGLLIRHHPITPISMRASSLSPGIYRHSPFHNANTQTPFLTAFATTFKNDDVRQAAELLAKANDGEWTDLSAWTCKPPGVGDKVRLLLEACKCMPHHQDKAAETLIDILEELQQAPADMEHGPAALEHMLHASTHERWVDLLAARPDLQARYRALLGKGPDAVHALCQLSVRLARRALFDQPGFVTRVPIYSFVFPGTLRDQKKLREKALQLFLHNAGKALGRRVTLREFEGIRCVQTATGQAGIEVCYLPEVADTIRYYLGLGREVDAYPDKPRCPKEAGFLSIVNQAGADFERLWLSHTRSQPAPAGTGSPIWRPFASRQEYAAVIEQLAAHNLLIAEDHGHFAGLNFIYQNMEWLRKRGFTLCLENLPAEVQNLADDFLAGRPLAPVFKLAGPHHAALLEKAKATGMRVLFVDSVFANPHHGSSTTKSYQARSARFNAFAADRIRAQCGSGKVVVLLGAFHAWIDNSDDAGGANIPGLQHALPNCRSLFIYDLTRTDGKVRDEDEEKPFLIVTHDQREKWTQGLATGQYRVMADVCVAARRPLQMSIANSARDGLDHKGVNGLTFPPDFSMT